MRTTSSFSEVEDGELGSAGAAAPLSITGVLSAYAKK